MAEVLRELKAKKTVIRRVELGYIRVDAGETPAQAIGYYAGPGGSLKLDKTKAEALYDPMQNCPGARAYRVFAELVP